MGQSERPAGQAEEPHASPMPEGGKSDENVDATGAPLSAGMRRIRKERLSATPVSNLDLLVEMDEPFSLIQELEQLACRARIKSKRWAEWDMVIEYVRKCRLHLEQAQEAE